MKSAIPLSLYHPGGLEGPKMGAGQTDVNLQGSGQHLNRFRPLGQQVEQFKSLGTSECLPHLGNLQVELIFKFSG